MSDPYKHVPDFIMRMKYWHKHLLVSILIGLLTLSPIAGGTFYLGRELRDVEKSHKWNWSKFDHKGLWWPLIPMIIADVVLKVFLVWQFVL